MASDHLTQQLLWVSLASSISASDFLIWEDYIVRIGNYQLGFSPPQSIAGSSGYLSLNRPVFFKTYSAARTALPTAMGQ